MDPRRFVMLLLVLAAAAIPCRAQDDFEAWKKKEAQRVQDFNTDQEKAFSQFLRADWERFNAFQSGTLFEKPEPKTTPVADPAKADHTFTEVPVKVAPPMPKPPEPLRPPPVVSPPPSPAPESKPVPAPPVETGVRVEVGFCDTALTVRTQPAAFPTVAMPLNNAAVADYWDAMAKAPADPLIQQLNAQRRTMRLNDWGYLELLRKTAERIYPQSENSRTLFVWTFLQQNGYRAKVGYVNDRMFLLIASRQILYGRPYFSFGDDGTRYYVLSLTGGREKPPASMYTYKGENAAAVNPFDLSLADAPRIRSLVASKSLTFEHHGAKQRVDVRWDASAVRFLQSYPETEFSVYYDASPSPEAASSLTDALRPIIRGKSQPEALDLLLHFVQTAFEYKTDEEQFGYQKVFTPDEILSYPYSACADRSVLFAYLVRALLNVPVVGLVYPNHMCTAVLDRAGLPGDHVRVGDASYIICDPTYINADHGMCMPQFKGVTPTVVMMKGPEGN